MDYILKRVREALEREDLHPTKEKEIGDALHNLIKSWLSKSQNTIIDHNFFSNTSRKPLIDSERLLGVTSGYALFRDESSKNDIFYVQNEHLQFKDAPCEDDLLELFFLSWFDKLLSEGTPCDVGSWRSVIQRNLSKASWVKCSSEMEPLALTEYVDLFDTDNIYVPYMMGRRMILVFKEIPAKYVITKDEIIVGNKYFGFIIDRSSDGGN